MLKIVFCVLTVFYTPSDLLVKVVKMLHKSFIIIIIPAVHSVFNVRIIDPSFINN